MREFWEDYFNRMRIEDAVLEAVLFRDSQAKRFKEEFCRHGEWVNKEAESVWKFSIQRRDQFQSLLNEIRKAEGRCDE